MAGAKITTKSKGKDEKSKGNKSISNTNEDSEEQDFSLLTKPILTSITGFAQARKIFDLATEELKGLLANECDLLYECKVCRNIFRSVANFISHKRVYCKEKFSSSLHSHFKNTSTVNEIQKIKQIEDAYQESLLDSKIDRDNNDERIPLTKDLTVILDKLTKTRGRFGSINEQLVTLQKIPNSTVAVFQNLSEEDKFDTMQAEVQEIDNILSQDNAVLQSDGTFRVQSLPSTENNEDTDNVIQISDDEETDGVNIPKCRICDMQFSTQKTLKFHMKYKHLESRLVYPCPDCFEIFSTSWSVYRHLFKVHRKSAAQIKRLRESIQSKAFKMNNPPAFYEKKKNMKPAQPQKVITEEERIDQENQAWMDNLEGDGELPRCGGCGRTFERRAALAAHTHTCQPRSRALRRPQEKKIEIQIRKDYNKGPPAGLILPIKSEAIDNKATSDDSNAAIIPRIEKPVEVEEKNLEEATMEIVEDEQKSNDSVEATVKSDSVSVQTETKTRIRLPFAQQTERNNLAAFKQRMQPDVDLEKLICKKCDSKHGRPRELYEHMAGHYKWMRYACKLCNFKHYDFEKLPDHVKIVHKLKGDSDFYFSTVKAIDGTEALELAEPVEEQSNDVNDTSPDSRRPSRCSSDSSRLSDDSSSSNTRIEVGSRKRKIYQNKGPGKRRKEIVINDDTEDSKDDASVERMDTDTSSIKNIEENSSDIDEIDERIAKKHIVEEYETVTSRRPVRKKTKPKNEDFEYDLSNLLKLEAQGYRDSQTVTVTKPTLSKKKILEVQSNYENINKEHSGALTILSKKAVDKAAAELKTTDFSAPYNPQKDVRVSNVFARPMLPKGISRGDKISPRKENVEEVKEPLTIPNKIDVNQEPGPSVTRVEKSTSTVEEIVNNTAKDDNKAATKAASGKISFITEQNTLNNELCDTVQTKLKIPAVVPIKFRRQSLEVMKNPIINKNITDFSKAGMKTKILLIKPINRNKDGTQSGNSTPLKFQTIKLKEPKKSTTSNEDKPNDQVVVVKVPKVDRAIVRPVSEVNKRNVSMQMNKTNSQNENCEEENSEKENKLQTLQPHETSSQQSIETDKDIDKISELKPMEIDSTTSIEIETRNKESVDKCEEKKKQEMSDSVTNSQEIVENLDASNSNVALPAFKDHDSAATIKIIEKDESVLDLESDSSLKESSVVKDSVDEIVTNGDASTTL